MRKALAPVASLLLGVAILLTGQGLQSILLPFRARVEAFSEPAIGIIGAGYFLGFTIGCLRGGHLVRRVGHVRVFAAMTALASAVPLIQALWVAEVPWFFFRAVMGFCFAVLYIVIESWLNERATNENRGAIFSAYIFVSFGTMALGQELLRVYDPAGIELFALVATLVSLAAIPVALTVSPTPDPPATAVIRLRSLWQVSPAGLSGSLASGLGNGAFWALAPVVAAGATLDAARTATFMSAAVIGGAAAQWPFGRLSDRTDRRRVIAALAGLAALASAAIWLAAPVAANPVMFALSFVWGAASFTVYPVSVAHTNDHADPEEFVGVSAGLLLAYGVGAIVGPLAASSLMAALAPPALYLFVGLVYLALALYVFARSLRYRAPPAAEHVDFADALSVAGTTSQAFEQELAEQKQEKPAVEAATQ